MTDLPQQQLSVAVGSSPFSSFLEYIPSGAQLTAFMSLVWGVKPAMDVWVPAEQSASFCDYAASLGVCTFVQGYLDRTAFRKLSVPEDRFTTTHAVWHATPRPGTEAHIFLAKHRDALRAVIAAGWYPVIIDGYFVEKHYADHRGFGVALGYPDCCVQFFIERNNWHDDNTYYASAVRTKFTAAWYMNSFLRHTPYTLLSHMPCSAECVQTRESVVEIWQRLYAELPTYADLVRTSLSMPILCLNENRIFQFSADVSGYQSVDYQSVTPLSPTSPSDPLYRLLRGGDRCVVDRNIVRIFREGTQQVAVPTYTDQYGPECPFIMRFDDFQHDEPVRDAYV
jgi:hypothetical protein